MARRTKLSDDPQLQQIPTSPEAPGSGEAGDEDALEVYDRPRRGSPLNLILAALVVLLLVGIAVAGYFVVRAAQTTEQPQTITDVQIQQIQQSIKKSPGDGGLYLALAASYYRVKAYDKALQTITELQSINPTGTILAESVYAQARIAQVRGDQDAALSTYLKSLGIAETADARWALGTLYLSRKQYDGAVKNLERYLVLMPRDADGYAKLGAAYEGRGDRKRALATYQKANSYVPGDSKIQAAIKRLKGQQ
jgi:tetratricopeptide (TPR) repeat protein